MSLQDAAAKAIETAQTATPAPEPAKETPEPAAAPAPEPAKAEAAPTLFFRKKEEKPAVDLSTLDPTKLPAEAQPFYKSMQADYTRKTQALADERRKLEAEMAAIGETRKMFEGFLSKVAEGRKDPAAAPAPDPMEEIKLLREQGEHEAADRRLMEIVAEQQRAALEPQRREIEIEKAKTAFRETTLAVQQNDKLVQAYFPQVVAEFDRTDVPELTAVKNDILSSPDLMRRHIPMLLNYLALRQHAQQLETALETKVESLVQERLKTERTKAAGLPKSLVSSGAVTKEGERPKMNLNESISAAMETLRSR